MSVNGFRCRKCGMVCISVYTHDFQACECGNFVDGGSAYRRMGGNPADMELLDDPQEEYLVEADQ